MGFKKTLFEAWAGTHEKYILNQDKKRAKRALFALLGTFWRFWGFYGENGVPDRPPMECKPAEKTVHHPSQVISEVLPRVNCALRACLRPKLTLGRTSEMTVRGGVPFSLLACIPWDACLAHRFHRKIPKIAKQYPKVQKVPFLHVFYLDSVAAYTLYGCQPEPRKVGFLTPNWEGLLKNRGFGSPRSTNKKFIVNQVGGTPT